MKTTQPIIDRIDRRMSYALEKPQMYARDASYLESLFFELDDVRAYALSVDNDNDLPQGRYASYLVEHGFYAHTFIGRKDFDNPQRIRDDSQDFQEFTDFWRGYLAWRDRP